jgi:D-alanyl-D-alanine carboxypeptidase
VAAPIAVAAPAPPDAVADPTTAGRGRDRRSATATVGDPEEVVHEVEVLAALTADELEEGDAPEVVTRVSSSGGRYWGVTVGSYTTRHEAERMLLRTALAEASALDGALRRVVQSGGGFNANFVGLSREQADLACRRLQARGTTCFSLSP